MPASRTPFPDGMDGYKLHRNDFARGENHRLRLAVDANVTVPVQLARGIDFVVSAATQAGLLMTCVRMPDDVRAGQCLGTLLDWAGDPVPSIRRG